MPREQLRRTLTRLHEELGREERLDRETLALLREVLGDIETRLEAEGAPTEETPDDEDSLADRLKEAARDFEASHPQLTEAVGRLADALAGMGL